MTLELDCPLIFLDTETTGTIPKIDYIVQLAIIKLYPDGRETAWSTLVRPPIQIPPEVVAIHGITDEAVVGAPVFAELAPKLKEGFIGCDFGAYNAPFDLRMLRAEFERCGIQGVPNGRIVDPNRYYHHFHRRNLEAAVREYLGPEEAERFKTEAHDAVADTRRALQVFRAQLERHPELPQTVAELNRQFFETPQDGRVDSDGAFFWRYGRPTFSFGKHLGESLEAVVRTDVAYLNWMNAQDFSLEVKHLIREAKQGRFPKPKAVNDAG